MRNLPSTVIYRQMHRHDGNTVTPSRLYIRRDGDGNLTTMDIKTMRLLTPLAVYEYAIKTDARIFWLEEGLLVRPLTEHADRMVNRAIKEIGSGPVVKFLIRQSQPPLNLPLSENEPPVGPVKDRLLKLASDCHQFEPCISWWLTKRASEYQHAHPSWRGWQTIARSAEDLIGWAFGCDDDAVVRKLAVQGTI